MFGPLNPQGRGKGLEDRGERDMHRTDRRRPLVTCHSGPIELVTPLFRIEQPPNQFADMPQIFFEVAPQVKIGAESPGSETTQAPCQKPCNTIRGHSK